MPICRSLQRGRHEEKHTSMQRRPALVARQLSSGVSLPDEAPKVSVFKSFCLFSWLFSWLR